MSSDPKTRVALVGAGFIAEFHAQILRRLPQVEIVAVVDPVIERAKRLASRHSIAAAFDSIDSMARGGTVEVAHVLSPPHLHVPVVRELLDRGIGAFVEKPLALSVEDCAELTERAARARLPLVVNHNHLFHPGFLALRERVLGGELGRIEHVIACLYVPLRQLSSGDFSHWMFSEPRNIVFEQAVHPFSQIHDLLGSLRSATTVRSGRRELLPGIPFFDTWDIAFECERGRATVLLSLGRDFTEHWLHVIGQDGSLRVDLLRRQGLAWFKTPSVEAIDQARNAFHNACRLAGEGTRNLVDYALSMFRLKDRTDAFYLGMKNSLSSFHQALRAGTSFPCGGASGLEVVRMCEAVTHALSRAALPCRPPAMKTPSAPPDGSGSGGTRRGLVLVTGATGYIGAHLVDRLFSQGFPVRVLARNPAKVEGRWRRAEVEVIQGELDDERALRRAVEGARAVVHLATGMGMSWAEVERGMVGASRALAERCLEAGVEKFLYCGTMAAYDFSDALAQPITEELALDPGPLRRSLYVRGKIAAESLLLSMMREKGLPLTILRPAVVVGENGAVHHSGVGCWTRDTHCIGWGRGRNPLPLVLVEDVVDAFVKVIEGGDLRGRVYNLAGDVRISAREYCLELGRRTGRRIHFHPQPLWWFQATEVFKWLVKKAAGRSDAEYPSFRDLCSRSLARPVDNSLPKRELGWRPMTDRERFLERLFESVAARNGEYPPGAETSVFSVQDPVEIPPGSVVTARRQSHDLERPR